SLKPHAPVGRPTPPPSAPRNASPSSTSYDAFFHSLGRMRKPKHGGVEVRLRRNPVAAARPSAGRLIEPIPAIQPGQQGLLLMPLSTPVGLKLAGLDRFRHFD